MPKVIAFLSMKGGCGATFVCAGVWHALSQKSYKVLALDMCFEKCTLDFALGFNNDYVYTLTDVIEGNLGVEEAISSDSVGSFLRAGYEKDDFDYDKASRIIKNTSYDYILMDVSGYCEEDAKTALSVADEIMLVTDCTPVCARFSLDFVQSMGDRDNISIIINKIVPYMIRDGIHLTIDEVLDYIGCHLKGLIPWDCGAEFILAGEDGGLENYPSLKASFGNLASRITGEVVPACDIEAFFKNSTTYKYLMKGRK